MILQMPMKKSEGKAGGHRKRYRGDTTWSWISKPSSAALRKGYLKLYPVQNIRTSARPSEPS